MSKVYVFNGWAANEMAWSRCSFERERIFSYGEQLDAVPERELENERDLVLVGWSMGGSSVLRMVLKFADRIKGLVLLAATPRMMAAPDWAGMSPRRLEALKKGLEITKGEGFFILQEDRPNVFSADDESLLDRGLVYLEQTDIREELLAFAAQRKLNFPVFIFQSERDGIVRAENAAFLARIFPQAVVEMIPGFEHTLSLVIPGKIDAAVAKLLADTVE